MLSDIKGSKRASDWRETLKHKVADLKRRAAQ